MPKGKPIGINEAHVRIPLKLLQSPAFIALPASAVKLYMDMSSQLRSTNNGDISATLSTLRHRGWNSPVTLAKSLRQLEAVGLIAKTRQTTGVFRGSTMCNLYRFTDRESYERPLKHVEASKATNDYLKFKSKGDAERAIKAVNPATPKSKNDDTESGA